MRWKDKRTNGKMVIPGNAVDGMTFKHGSCSSKLRTLCNLREVSAADLLHQYKTRVRMLGIVLHY